MTATVDKKKQDEEETVATTTTKTITTKKQQQPPLVSAIRRLERLLKSSSSSNSTAVFGSSESTDADYWKNPPAKVVKRWLGTTSGTAQTASLADISQATKLVLNPEISSKGRELLLLATSDDAMETTAGGDDDVPDLSPTYVSAAASREVEAWLLSCTIRLLWREKKLEPAFRLAQQSVALVEGHLSSSSSPASDQQQTTTTTSTTASGLFPLLARLYRYQSLVIADDASRTLALRPTLVRAHGTASQRRDVDSQATLLNLILHDLLNASQVEQAQKLLSNSTFPDSAPNNQLCRYLYYSGRIQALRLDYTSAFSSLSTCFRKAPTNTGLGFRIATQRLLIVVQLLMGEIPNRQQAFSQHDADMKKELEPYLHITQAVRRGDLSVFTKVVADHAQQFKQDQTFTLISRLEHVVVKAGLRQLQVAYSRIRLEDIAHRLGLGGSTAGTGAGTSAEFVVSKAIRDGVVEATIHHEEQYVESHDVINVYSTSDPQAAFHRRIAYCLTTHNDAIRGMRYPPDAYKKQLEASRGPNGKSKKKDSDDKTDEERARELEDEMEEDY